MKKHEVGRMSRDGMTVGITLRLEVALLEAYTEMARTRNVVDLRSGGKGRLTAQDIMRERLASLPELVNKGDIDET